MRIEQPNPNDFDALLRAGLKNHTINVPPDFTQKLLTRVQRQEYAAALAAIRMKERLLLAVMILVPVAAIAIALLMPQQIITQLSTSIAEAQQKLLADFNGIVFSLRNWIVIAAAAGLLLYGLFESLLAEN